MTRHFGIPARASDPIPAPASWKTWAVEIGVALAGFSFLLLGYSNDWWV